jgi:hypothetical protein
MKMADERNIWLRGPVYGIPPLLVPVAHSLLQAREDAAHAVAGVHQETLWKRPNGAAPAGFHLFHAAHALDRLMTYARGKRFTTRNGARSTWSDHWTWMSVASFFSSFST